MRPAVARVAASIAGKEGQGDGAVRGSFVTVEVEERQLDALVERCEKAELQAAAHKRKAAETVAHLRFVEAELARSRRACEGLSAQLR